MKLIVGNKLVDVMLGQCGYYQVGICVKLRSYCEYLDQSSSSKFNCECITPTFIYFVQVGVHESTSCCTGCRIELP